MDGPSIETHVRELVGSSELDAAATTAIRGFGPQILRYLRAMLRDEDLAADAFSQWAENLWKGLAGYRGDASLRTWAFRLAHHAALNLRQEAWRRHGRRLQTGEASRIADAVRTKTAVRVERQRQLFHQLREALTPEELSLLELRVEQGLSWAEIAAVVSEPDQRVEPATLMKRFERIKTRLAKLAREQGLIE
jgi:RNA polymerase sigma-70 factor (ECF subfamily)